MKSKTMFYSIAVVTAVLISSLKSVRVAHADPFHETEPGPSISDNSSNPGHLWIGIGAGKGGEVSSGGRRHDPYGGGYIAPRGGDWAMDIVGGGQVKFYASYAGYGQGPPGYPVINPMAPVVITGRLAAAGGTAECQWQKIEVLVSWTDNLGHGHGPDLVGWVAYEHMDTWKYSVIGATIDNGAVLGNVYNYTGPPGCSEGTHLHMEFHSEGQASLAYEWHGWGPDWYYDGHVHSQHGKGRVGDWYVGLSEQYPPSDFVDASETVGLLGGDRAFATMWMNPCYTRRPPTRPLATSASVSETYATIWFNDNSCDEESIFLKRQVPGDWIPVSTIPGDRAISGGNAISDFGLSRGSYYGYWLYSKNVYGESPAGSYLTAITLGPPVAPQAVSAFGRSTTSIRVQWSDRSSIYTPPGDETKFVVTRYIGGS